MLERRTRLGKYEVMEELGIGAMATVYKAKNVEDGSPVALKIPDRRWLTSAGALRQFSREGSALKTLSHPNIVKVHTLGEQSGLPYIVMDYVDGCNLAQEIKVKGIFGIDEVVHKLEPIAAALDYSHSCGIVHRDVKPGNIRIRRDACPVLVDFGIVQTADGTIWDEGKTIGSPWYMSPEQACGTRADGRSDQYSLAIVAYEMLAGKVPFEGSNAVAVAVQQRDTEPPIPANWSGPLAAVMRRSLEKDPDKRFSSCREFIQALKSAARGQMPSAVTALATPSLTQPKPSPMANRIESPKSAGTVPVLVALAVLFLLLLYFASTNRDPRVAQRPVSIPQSPTWDARQVKTSDLRFFSAASALAIADRQFKTRFPTSTTREVNWQTVLNFAPPSYSTSFQLETRVSAPQDIALDATVETITVEVPRGSTQATVSGRSLHPAGKHWRSGTYTLVLLIQGTDIATGTFEIYDDAKERARNGDQVFRIER